MDIKVLTENYFLESLKLSEYAFQYKIVEERIPARRDMLKKHKILGILEQEKLAAKLHIIPLAVNMNGEEWKMGGIAGVATYPEYRRSGYVRSLMIEALRQMLADGQIVSLLHPFDFSFYRKYGWEILSEYKKVSLEKKDLALLPISPGRIIRYSKEDFPQDINHIYQMYCNQFNGMLVRSFDWWKDQVIDDNSQIAVYYNQANEAKGYILYHVKDRKMDVEEMVCLNQEARVGLWNFICQHDSMVEKVFLTLPIHDPFPYFIQQPKVSMELQPYFMARIVDVEECLRKFEFNSETEPVFLHLEDTFAPWNNGSYLIGHDQLKVFKEKNGSQCVQPPKRGIHLSINDLSAIIFGYKRPLELYQMGYLKGSEEEVQKLERMVPHIKSSFYDFF
ncbi:GNAT family N-acetyltransferase [Bacillus sp. 1P10SD]|uniref:GNAT family N-acetyltransferase n=1 Tax=Bacillus sp. 1P10SD TaxID=3132265 RepID=UPI0039A5A1C2